MSLYFNSVVDTCITFIRINRIVTKFLMEPNFWFTFELLSISFCSSIGNFMFGFLQNITKFRRTFNFFYGEINFFTSNTLLILSSLSSELLKVSTKFCLSSIFQSVLHLSAFLLRVLKTSLSLFFC